MVGCSARIMSHWTTSGRFHESEGSQGMKDSCVSCYGQIHRRHPVEGRANAVSAFHGRASGPRSDNGQVLVLALGLMSQGTGAN